MGRLPDGHSMVHAQTDALRLLVSCTMFSPLAFFMGMRLPVGILELAESPRGAIASAWSLNGLFTTTASIASALIALRFRRRPT